MPRHTRYNTDKAVEQYVRYTALYREHDRTHHRMTYTIYAGIAAIILLTLWNPVLTLGILASMWCAVRIYKSLHHLWNNYKILRTLGLTAVLGVTATFSFLFSNAIAANLGLNLTLIGLGAPVIGQIALAGVLTFAATLSAKYLFKAIAKLFTGFTNPEKRAFYPLNFAPYSGYARKQGYEKAIIAIYDIKPQSLGSLFPFTYCGRERATLNSIIHRLREGKIQHFRYLIRTNKVSDTSATGIVEEESPPDDFWILKPIPKATVGNKLRIDTTRVHTIVSFEKRNYRLEEEGTVSTYKIREINLRHAPSVEVEAATATTATTAATATASAEQPPPPAQPNSVAGIPDHQHSFTVALYDGGGVSQQHPSFQNSIEVCFFNPWAGKGARRATAHTLDEALSLSIPSDSSSVSAAGGSMPKLPLPVA